MLLSIDYSFAYSYRSEYFKLYFQHLHWEIKALTLHYSWYILY